MNPSIANLRRDYRLLTLNENEVAPDPLQQFSHWWHEAIKSEIDEVNAMALATATPTGMPSARIVLLKGFDENGFVFFTNYNSEKGKEIAANPHAALLFFWKELERQVRIEGRIEKISATDSDAYFQSRPPGSRIGAWTSPQSEVIEGRDELEMKYAELEKQFGAGEIARPAHWGGYAVKPVSYEFWQGRSSRLHDRIRYSFQNNNWKIERLAP